MHISVLLYLGVLWLDHWSKEYTGQGQICVVRIIEHHGKILLRTVRKRELKYLFLLLLWTRNYIPETRPLFDIIINILDSVVHKGTIMQYQYIASSLLKIP